MNQRVEKLEGILEKQQSFLNQFLQSLQEVKPTDKNWNGTIQSLQKHLEKIEFSKGTEITSGKSEDQQIAPTSIGNMQKEIEYLKKREQENQKIISSYDTKIENLQQALSNQKSLIQKLTNHQNNLPIRTAESTKNINLNINDSDPNVVLNELKTVVNAHSAQISSILDSPVFSLPPDADVKIHEFDTDLQSIKTMLRNQADIWSEFESTIQALVQFKEETNESSGSDEHNTSTDNNSTRRDTKSQSLQDQIRCLKYEIKKVRQEISAYSDQQESMSRDKGLDMPNRFNKINNEIGNLKKSINDSNNKIDALSEKVDITKPEKKIITIDKVSDSISCIKHELKRNIQKISNLFESFEKVQKEISTLQTRQTQNDETINQIRQLFDPVDETSQTNSVDPNSNTDNNNNTNGTPAPFKLQMKNFVERVQGAQNKSTKQDETIELLTQKYSDIVKSIKILNTIKQPFRALQESNEHLKRDVEQMKQILQVPTITDRDVKTSNDGSNFSQPKSITEVVAKHNHEIQLIQNDLKQKEPKLEKEIKDLQEKQAKLQESVTKLQDEQQKHESNQGGGIASFLSLRRDRSNSSTSNNNNAPPGLQLLSGTSSSNLFRSSEGIPLASPGSTSQSRDQIWTRSTTSNGNNEGASNEADTDIDFDDLSPPSTPIIIKSTFETADDIVDAFRAIAHEQNRERRVIDRLVDAIKQGEIKNSKIKYLDKMMQEMRNRSSEQGDMLMQLKTKQGTQEKNFQQMSKTVRFLETLNISNEIDSIKKHLKNLGSNSHSGTQPFQTSARNDHRSPIRSHVSQPMQQYDDSKAKKSSKPTNSSTRTIPHARKDSK